LKEIEIIFWINQNEEDSINLYIKVFYIEQYMYIVDDTNVDAWNVI